MVQIQALSTDRVIQKVFSYLGKLRALKWRNGEYDEEQNSSTGSLYDPQDPWNWDQWLFEEPQRDEILVSLFKKEHVREMRSQLLPYLLFLQTQTPEWMRNDGRNFKLGILLAIMKNGDQHGRSDKVTLRSLLEKCFSGQEIKKEQEEDMLTTIAKASMLSTDWNLDQWHQDLSLLPDLFQTYQEKVTESDANIYLDDLFKSADYLPDPEQNKAYISYYTRMEPMDKVIKCSELNITIITSIGDLEIQWVSDFSQHLLLNHHQGVLYVFWHAAICKAIADESARFFLQLGLTAELGKEILHTYWILFGCTSSARKAYLSLPAPEFLDRLSKTRGGSITKLSAFTSPKNFQPYDMALHLCEEKDSLGVYRYKGNTFQVGDYPYYGYRLLVLKECLKHKKPSGLWSLWGDRRDSHQWYTLWFVLSLGAFSLLISLLSLGSSVCQTWLAWKTVKITEQQLHEHTRSILS